jgi:hypothetical protein
MQGDPEGKFSSHLTANQGGSDEREENVRMGSTDFGAGATDRFACLRVRGAGLLL